MAAETKIVISQIPPYDGEYEIDLEQAFSAKEWRWLKKLSDGELRPGNLSEDDLSDPDFVIALAVIAMRRTGKISADQVLEVADRLSEKPLTDAYIHLVLPEEEEESLPPASTSEPSSPSGSGSLENESSQTPSNETGGSSSRLASVLSDVSQERTGPTRSDMSLVSAPTTSTT